MFGQFSSKKALLGVVAIDVIVQILSGSAYALDFIPGDLVVSVEGNGSGTASGGTSATGNTGANATTYLDNQAAPITLYQYSLNGTTSATAAGSMTLPQTSTPGGNFAVSGEYGSSSEGTLQLSGNGQYLTIMGYGVNAQTYNSAHDLNGGGTALAQSTNGTGASTDVARVVALIGANGSVNSTTALTNVFNGNNPRSVFTQDGTSFYVSGQGNKDATGGVFYVPNVGATTAVPITGIDTNSKSNGNFGQDTRDVQIVKGQLYVSVDSSEGSKSFNIDRIGTLGTAGNAPTTTLNQQPAALNGINGQISLSNGNGNSINGSNGNVYLSPESFFFANSNTLYIADSGAPKNGSQGNGTNAPGDGGLQKWSLVNGTWKLDYTISTGLNLVNYTTNTDGVSGLYGLTGEVVGGNVELFATSYVLGDTDQTYLYGLTDVLDDTTANQAAGETFSILEAAPADSSFKGVAFAPTATPLPGPWSFILVGLGAIGMFRWRGRLHLAA